MSSAVTSSFFGYAFIRFQIKAYGSIKKLPFPFGLFTFAGRLKIEVRSHPIMYAYLTKGWLWSKAAKWKRKYKNGITVKPDTNYHLTEFHFYDANGEEIKM